MNLNKIAIIAAMEQEACAICPAPHRDHSGKFEILSGTLKNGIKYKCAVSGLGMDRAAEAAAMLCAEAPDLILSIGVSGGLAPGLNSGTLVLASSIHSDHQEYDSWHESDADAQLRSRLIPACGEIQCGKLVTAAKPVLTPQAKLEMYERTGALAVDMESVAVADAAKEAGIPFCCIRAISDDSKKGIPSEALAGVNEAGRAQLIPILKAIAKHPALILKLIPMGRDYSKALKSLQNILN